MSCNEALKKARKAKGYTQQRMAELLGYRSKSGYNMIELGSNKPPLKKALKIAELLDVSLEELFAEYKEEM